MISEMTRVTYSSSAIHIISPIFRMPRSGMLPMDVPNALKDVEEVVVTHTKTSRGTVTRQKVVPIVLPTPEGSGQPSKSKKKSLSAPKRTTTRSDKGIPTDHLTEFVEDTPFRDEQDYEVPDLIVEPSRPKASVGTISNPDSRAHQCSHRLRSINGLSFGMAISIYY